MFSDRFYKRPGPSIIFYILTLELYFRLVLLIHKLCGRREWQLFVGLLIMGPGIGKNAKYISNLKNSSTWEYLYVTYSMCLVCKF